MLSTAGRREFQFQSIEIRTSKTMKAAQVASAGGDFQVVECDMPSAALGEALIKVERVRGAYTRCDNNEP